MALKGVTVPIPDNKIVLCRKEKYTYVYRVLKAYRNKNGKPTSSTILIGKVDPDNSSRMIPNDHYYDYYQTGDEIIDQRTPLAIESYGVNFVLKEIYKRLGLDKILNDIFLTDASKIEICSYYTLCKGAVMSYIDDWCETTYNSYSMQLTSQSVSRLFTTINIHQIKAFFKEWAAKRIEHEYIAYDVTSISSYSTNIQAVEWGYNRDNEELPQINLGMYYGESSNLPIYYNSYYGSITDKEHLKYMMEGTKELGIDNVRFVMDKGFYKKENLNYMVKNNYPFIICLSNSSIYAKKMIDEARNKVRDAKYILSDNYYFGMILPKSQEQIMYNMHVIFNSEKEHEETCLIFERILKYENELSKMDILPKKISKYEKYFKITINRDNTFTYERDYDKINKEMSYAGYIVFLTTDLNLTTDRVLSIYRNKDVVEKCFDNLKNELDLKRLRIHSDKAWDGKMFITFIALILRSYIEKEKKNNKITKQMTLERIILELEKLKIVTYGDSKKLLNPFTSKQKEILQVLQISQNDIIKSLENI